MVGDHEEVEWAGELSIIRKLVYCRSEPQECGIGRAVGKRVESWVVTEEFWHRVEPLIPARVPKQVESYVRKPGAGRPPKPARQVFEAVVYVLRTGCQWKALPKERFGSASAVHKRFLEWEQAGFFEEL